VDPGGYTVAVPKSGTRLPGTPCNRSLTRLGERARSNCATTALARNAACRGVPIRDERGTTLSRPALHPDTIDRGVYGTIVVTSALVIYDGWGNLKLRDAIVVIVGPLVAMVIGHVFAAAIAAYPTLGHRPAGSDVLAIVRRESRFLLVCLPQIVLLLLLTLAGLSLSHTVRVLIWIGPVVLGFWGGVAGWYAGGRGRALLMAVLAGLAVGAIVLLLQVFLQPGKAVTNGVAATQAAHETVA
jgi:hypothetical protein